MSGSMNELHRFCENEGVIAVKGSQQSCQLWVLFRARMWWGGGGVGKVGRCICV